MSDTPTASELQWLLDLERGQVTVDHWSDQRYTNPDLLTCLRRGWIGRTCTYVLTEEGKRILSALKPDLDRVHAEVHTELFKGRTP